MTPTSQPSELEQYVGRLATEFPFFLKELWSTLGFEPAQHQVWMSQYLQHGPRRRGVLAWRGSSKTWVTLAYCVWRLFVDNETRVLLVSKSERHSRDSLYMARNWIDQVEWLRHLSPDRRAGQRDSATKFDIGPASNDRTASFTAASITGQITGTRATLIIGDDVETAVNTITLEMRQRLRELVKEFENIIVPGGDIIYLGTPWHEESLYWSIAEAGYEFRSYPARVPKDEKVPFLAPEVRDMADNGKAGSSIWPDRFTTLDLMEREAAEGRTTFLMQYQMVTDLSDGDRYPLTLKDAIVFPVLTDKAPISIAWGQRNDRGGTTRCEDIPSLGFGTDGWYSPIFFDDEWHAYTGTVMWIDPSGRGKDKTAYAVVSHLHGYLWVHEVKGLDGGFSPATLDTLANAAKRTKARRVLVEDNFGQGMFVSLLEPYLQRLRDEEWGASIEPVRVSGQKEIRIITALEPVLNQHRLVVHPDVARNQDLQRQWTRITRQRQCLSHDDEIEALAMACNAWQLDLAVDPEKARQRTLDLEQERRIRESYAAIGRSMPSARWHRHQ